MLVGELGVLWVYLYGLVGSGCSYLLFVVV